MSDQTSRIVREQVRTMYSQAPSPIVTSLLVGIFLILILWDHTPHGRLLGTLAAIMLVSFSRLALTRLFTRASPADAQYPRWGRIFVLGLGAQGSLWGIGAVVLSPHDSMLHQVIVLMWVVGLAGGAVALYSVQSKAVLAFVIPVLLPMIIFMFSFGDRLHFYLGFSILSYLGLMIVTMSSAHVSIIKSLELTVALQTEIAEREKSEKQYQSLFEGTVEGILLHRRGFVVAVNPPFLEMFGYRIDDEDKVIGTTVLQHLDEASKYLVSERLKAIESTPNIGADLLELKAIRQDGSSFDIEVIAKPHPSRKDDVRLLSIRDTSRRMSAERELKSAHEETEQANLKLAAANRELAGIIDNLQDVFYRTNNKGELIWLSPAGKDVLGYEEKQVLGKQLTDLFVNSEQRLQFVEEMERSGGVVKNFEALFKHQRGEAIWISINSQFYRSQGNEIAGAEGTLRDITERVAMESELLELSKQDGLTGLANRRQFDQVLEMEWSTARREKKCLSLIMIDVDFFKHYNDSYGHLQGDVCLKQICKTVQSSTHRPSDLAARYGGEALAVILPNTDLEGARQVAEILRAAVKDLKMAHQQSAICDHVTVSAGVAALVPMVDLDSSELVKLADAALYKAKAAGRDTVIVSNP